MAPSRCSAPSAASSPSRETVWRQADKYGIPRIAFVNKMDRIGADFFRGLEMMIERLGANPVALQIPIGREAEFRGIIDLIEMNALVYQDELGTDFEIATSPSELPAAGRRVPPQAHRVASPSTTTTCSRRISRAGRSPPRTCAR